MLRLIAERHTEIAVLCRSFGVKRLSVFGSAARDDFDPSRSDLDFLVEFDRDKPGALSLKTFFDFKDQLEALFGRDVDLVEREAVEASRNFIRRKSILQQAQPIYG
jgi:uncharacterized protein